MRTRKQDRANCAILAVIVGVFILAELLSVWKNFWLYQDARQLTATIITEGSKPGTFEYEYTVDGVRYLGSGQEGRGLPDQAHIGEQVLVFVSSSHSSLSSAEVPNFPVWRYSVILILLLWAELSLLKNTVGEPAHANQGRRDTNKIRR